MRCLCKTKEASSTRKIYLKLGGTSDRCSRIFFDLVSDYRSSCSDPFRSRTGGLELSFYVGFCDIVTRDISVAYNLTGHLTLTITSCERLNVLKCLVFLYLRCTHSIQNTISPIDIEEKPNSSHLLQSYIVLLQSQNRAREVDMHCYYIFSPGSTHVAHLHCDSLAMAGWLAGSLGVVRWPCVIGEYLQRSKCSASGHIGMWYVQT